MYSSSKDMDLTNFINTSFYKEGFILKYIGKGDNIHRHYPNGFVYYFDGIFHLSQERTDTIKSIPSCYDVWEYMPK